MTYRKWHRFDCLFATELSEITNNEENGEYSDLIVDLGAICAFNTTDNPDHCTIRLYGESFTVRITIEELQMLLAFDLLKAAEPN